MASKDSQTINNATSASAGSASFLANALRCNQGIKNAPSRILRTGSGEWLFPDAKLIAPRVVWLHALRPGLGNLGDCWRVVVFVSANMLPVFWRCRESRWPWRWLDRCPPAGIAAPALLCQWWSVWFLDVAEISELLSCRRDTGRNAHLFLHQGE